MAAITVETLVQRKLDAFRDSADGDRAPIYGLTDLAPAGEAKVGCLRITSAYRVETSRAESVSAFRCRFSQTWPALADFDLAAHGLVMAGGAPAALLQFKEGAFDRCGDVDLFALAPPGSKGRDAVLAAADALGKHLLLSASEPGDLTVSRTQNSFTFVLKGGSAKTRYVPDDKGLWARRPVPAPLVVQVIFRPYKSVAEVLYGFDLGSCAVAYDGSTLSFSPAGRYSAERMANMVDLSMWRPSYDARLLKYFDRGYDVVIPNPPEGFELAGTTLLGNFVVCPSEGRYHLRLVSPADVASEYEAANYDYADPAALRFTNLSAAVRGSMEGLCAHATLTPEFDIGTLRPTVEPGDVVAAVRKILGVSNSISPKRYKQLRELLGKCAAAELIKLMAESEFDLSEEMILKLAGTRVDRLRNYVHAWRPTFEPRPLRPVIPVDPAAWFHCG